MSKWWKVLVKPRGPHQTFNCSGSVQLSKTSARGASRTRVVTISRRTISSYSFAMFFRLFVFFCFHHFQVLFELVSRFHPETSVALHPCIHLNQRLERETAGPLLRGAAARNEAGALKDM